MQETAGMMKSFISPPSHSRSLSQSVKPCFPDKAANRNESINVHAHTRAHTAGHERRHADMCAFCLVTEINTSPGPS